MLKKGRLKRKKRVRSKIFGVEARPRLSVFRSNRFIYAQLIDDQKARTLLESHGKDPSEVGEDLAKKALKKKIRRVVFDRSGYKFHGKIKKLAEAARKGGLNF